MRGVALTLAALFTAGCATAADGPGALVIAGGGLKSDTAAVWQAFLAETPDGGPIVIVASASGDPVLSAASVEQTLLSYGIPRDRIRTAKLATMDDRSTPDVDESLWSANGRDPDTFALLRGASALWFTGGDQSRTTQILLGTPALDAVRDARRNGAPIGGTSAGAAIMSDPMITQGDTLSALGVSEAGEALGLAPGLGFLPGVLVDQHFGERARLGRLLAGLAAQADPARRLGIGIDEDTALVVTRQGWRVEGRGSVTLVDARNAEFSAEGALHASGITLHLASSGDRIDPATLRPTPAGWRDATVGTEYIRTARPSGGGMALPPERLDDVIGEGLLDNAQSRTTQRVSFDGSGTGVRYRFEQTEASQGYWGRDPDTDRAAYTITDVRFAVEPVDVVVRAPD